jgi:hypothetical protein
VRRRVGAGVKSNHDVRAVSIVSHATTPADQIIKTEIDKQEEPESKALLDDLYQQLKAIYDANSFVSSGGVLEKMIDDSLVSLKHEVEQSSETLRWAFGLILTSALTIAGIFAGIIFKNKKEETDLKFKALAKKND